MAEKYSVVAEIGRAYRRLDQHMLEILRGTSVALVLKVLAAGIAFLFHVAVARLLGPGGTGTYFLA
jgi:O-antigen/teichoic acid export membrane protein